MKMKHAAALSMAALMGLSLVGCGGSNAGTETTAAADSKAADTKAADNAGSADGEQVVINFFHRCQMIQRTPCSKSWFRSIWMRIQT